MSQTTASKKNILQGIALSMNSKMAILDNEDVKSVTAILIKEDTVVTAKDIDGNENTIILSNGMILVLADDIVTLTTDVAVYID